MKLLFVCLGNICRSPAAEAIMLAKCQERGESLSVACDSAGTSAYHLGEPADPRMQQALQARGYQSHSRGRQVQPLDFQTFDLILAMDRQNLESLRQACPSAAQTTKIKLMTEFCEQHDTKDVPDPYFGGQDGFDHVIDLLEDACDGLLKHLEERAGR